LEDLTKDSHYVCLNVESIAEKARVDTRTAKLHLDLMEDYNVGKFCDPKKKTYQMNKQVGGK
jgi:hypothetical protein